MTHTRNIFIFFICLITPLLLGTLSNVQAQEQIHDIENGKRIFNRCIACHFADRETNKVGPSLLHIIGKKAGTKPNFRYSPAMIREGEAGLVWTPETLKTYLNNPQALVRGTRMASIRIKDDKEIDDLITYLKTFDKNETNE